MWVTFNLLQREKTRRRKNIDNWKVFSYARGSSAEMRARATTTFSIRFFSLHPPPSYSRLYFLSFVTSNFSSFPFLRAARSLARSLHSRIGNQINFPTVRGFVVFCARLASPRLYFRRTPRSTRRAHCIALSPPSKYQESIGRRSTTWPHGALVFDSAKRCAPGN